VLQPRQATETELLTIHTPAYVSAALAGTAEKDSSTYFHTKNSVSAGAARLAAGSTMQVAEEGVVVCVWVGVCVCVGRCFCVCVCVYGWVGETFSKYILGLIAHSRTKNL
jgi:hypothetical protein